jgi:hypothetical protein
MRRNADLQLLPTDLKIQPKPEFVAKTLIYINNPVKTYDFDPDTNTLIDRGSSVGHTFIKIEDKRGNTVDIFEHVPGKPRGDGNWIKFQPIPESFSEVEIMIRNTGSHTIECISNAQFRHLYMKNANKVVPAEFFAYTHDSAPARDLESLILEASKYNTIIAFMEPIQKEQLEKLRQTREELKKVGYNVRNSNCSIYPRVLLDSQLTNAGRKKIDTSAMGPHLLNDIYAHRMLVKAGKAYVEDKGEQIYLDKTFNLNDKFHLRTFLDGKPKKLDIDLCKF